MSTHRTNRNEWPHVTPTGFTYEQPTTYQEFLRLHDTAAQATIEGWDEPEHPPQPTWETLRPVHGRIGSLTSRCDRMTEIINRPDPSRRWREVGLVVAGVLVGLEVAMLFGLL